MPDLLEDYDTHGFFCELTTPLQAGNASNDASGLADLKRRLNNLNRETLRNRAADIELELFNSGITFTVYSDKEAIDRVFPVDVIPRVITAGDFAAIEKGVTQRIAAINAFLHDIYHDQHILRDGIVPTDLVLENDNYRPQMQGLELPHRNYVNIAGTDLVRGADGVFRVLEDNVRTPSGVSYVLENRHLMRRAFSDLMEDIPVRTVSAYGEKLHQALVDMAPHAVTDPQVVLLSPGTYNSAYFEHVSLSREMGVPLVEGSDLSVGSDDRVYMNTINGPQPVHVVYRRIDDDFLDPDAFRRDSMLGVSGLVRAYLKGNVILANAIGTGVADDKALYAYMPRIIDYYLSEEALLPNVHTNICREKEGLEYTLAHLDELVVKPVGASGGYGITIGPKATREELAACRAELLADPANYISQPVVQLSVCPTLVPQGVEARHVDLRPFAVTGADTWVLPGGLTRVALKKGSLIVNSSQGGGSKDTWVLEGAV